MSSSNLRQNADFANTYADSKSVRRARHAHPSPTPFVRSSPILTKSDVAQSQGYQLRATGYKLRATAKAEQHDSDFRQPCIPVSQNPATRTASSTCRTPISKLRKKIFPWPCEMRNTAPGSEARLPRRGCQALVWFGTTSQELNTLAYDDLRDWIKTLEL